MPPFAVPQNACVSTVKPVVTLWPFLSLPSNPSFPRPMCFLFCSRGRRCEHLMDTSENRDCGPVFHAGVQTPDGWAACFQSLQRHLSHTDPPFRAFRGAGTEEAWREKRTRSFRWAVERRKPELTFPWEGEASASLKRRPCLPRSLAGHSCFSRQGWPQRPN